VLRARQRQSPAWKPGFICIPENFSGPDNYFFLAAPLDFAAVADLAAAAGLAALAGLPRAITVALGLALAYPGFT
jgi:hypothetical protein